MRQMYQSQTEQELKVVCKTGFDFFSEEGEDDTIFNLMVDEYIVNKLNQINERRVELI